MRRAVYPGNFDPITNGHLDIIERAAGMFDEVIVAVGKNLGKSPLFSAEERVEMIREVCSHLPNVKAGSYDGLTVRYAASQDARVIVRGLRALSDFDYEFEMALTNRRLDSGMETVFLMTNAEYSFLSSSLVKEVAGFGGSVEGLVPKAVQEHLRRKLESASG
jgi:pantetheine-phosphate adenylyltransferase